MRLSVRFVVPLIAVLSLLAYGLIPIVDTLSRRWAMRDLNTRAQLIASSVEDPLLAALRMESPLRAEEILRKITKDDRLLAVGYCDARNKLAKRTPLFPAEISCKDIASLEPDRGFIRSLPGGDVHIAAPLLTPDDPELGRLIVIHDMSFALIRGRDTKRYLFYLFLVIGFVISIVTVLVAEISWRGWIEGMRKLLTGASQGRGHFPAPSKEFQPIVKELRHLIHDMERTRKARDESQLSWTPRTLKEILHRDFSGDQILVVSNREPYIHHRNADGTIQASVPASGLVTALEPVLRACSGIWIAHGSGDADHETVDAHDHVRVPPSESTARSPKSAPSESLQYDIRRVWLSREEEKGYYYGFANEGLWPLCHIAHTRPIFRTADWEQYVKVNQKFCDVVIEEAKTSEPVILVQDYHFALLPRMIRKHLPRATIITFWHIPWPNPEAFGICPWKEEILIGLLGSSILGFHTQFHCNNFLDTIDRSIESRIDHENHSIIYNGKTTEIRPYPISIEWPSRWLNPQKPASACKRLKRLQHGLPPEIKLGIGVDRLDYTKGIAERFLAIERFLEKYPEWIKKFSFIQIAAPSRGQIESYHQLELHVRAEAERINKIFGDDHYKPILLLIEHHEPSDVFEYFRAAEFCLVSSLHDGMNLVAKEYLAARDDEQGVLILSSFTGAARELPEALIVNPYNIDQCSEAVHIALTMPPNEQRERMRSMRGLIQEHNVFRWAGRMLLDAARVRERNRFTYRASENIGERPRAFDT